MRQNAGIERRKWDVAGLIATITLILSVLGSLLLGARWAEKVDLRLDQNVTKADFSRLDEKVNGLTDRVGHMDCKLNDGCGSSSFGNRTIYPRNSEIGGR